MYKYYLDKTTTMPDIVDVIFSAKWRKPDGKNFENGNWADISVEQQKILFMLGVTGMEKLTPNIAEIVRRDTDKRAGKILKRGRKRKINTN